MELHLRKKRTALNAILTLYSPEKRQMRATKFRASGGISMYTNCILGRPSFCFAVKFLYCNPSTSNFFSYYKSPFIKIYGNNQELKKRKIWRSQRFWLGYPNKWKLKHSIGLILGYLIVVSKFLMKKYKADNKGMYSYLYIYELIGESTKKKM